jgi:hypothetical protein
METMMRVVMMAAALASGGAWTYETTRDPLGQTVYVAEVVPDQARPYVAMRLMCGGIAGVVLQVNLGQMQYASMTAPASGLSFDVGGAPAYLAAASMAPITDGVGTYEIKGSEAGNIAHLLMQGESVTVHQGAASLTFPLSGAARAIGAVISNCPFKL